MSALPDLWRQGGSADQPCRLSWIVGLCAVRLPSDLGDAEHRVHRGKLSDSG